MSGTRCTIYLAGGAFLVTLPFWISNLDLIVSRHFYGGTLDHWPTGDAAVFEFLYDYGHWPSWAVAWLSLGALVAVRWIPASRARIRLAAFSLLLFIVGPWVLVNLVFKEHFGRPRPRHIVEFGGDRDYLPPLVPGDEAGASFPAGHPSMGFIWMGYGVYLHASRPRRALGFLALGAVHGAVLGLARIAQGAHFLSDVVWSAVFVLATALLLYYPLGLRPPPEPVDNPDAF